MGAGLIWLGRRGQSGQIDFAMSKYNRENTTPQSWQDAHEVTGEGIVRSGAAFLVGSVIYPIAHNTIGENAAAIFMVAIMVLATALVLAGGFQGLKVLGEPGARPDGMTRFT